MTWRHFLLLALFGAMLLVNGVLLAFEDVNLAVTGDGPVNRIEDPLLGAVYAPGERLRNFGAFGLPDDLATQAAARAEVIYNDNERLKIMLSDNADYLSQFFCPGARPPERYGAMHVLVSQRDIGGGVLERNIFDWRRSTELVIQDWVPNSRVNEVYSAVELTERRRANSTVMGVSAVLTVREDDLFERNAPFGTINWRFQTLRTNHPELDAKLVEYFALMHVITELARRRDDGICR